MRSTRTFLAPALAGRLRRRLASRCLGRRFGVAFAGFYRRRIAGNVADQSIFLCFTNQSFVYELWQFHAGELVERPREGRFVRHLPGVFPATEAAQLRVA